jgi:NAD+ synthase (glutamine-hydrolysing)
VGALRVALCQLDPVVGDLEGNVRRILGALERAEEEQADLAVFPELAVTGYPPEDLLLEPGFVQANLAALDEVAAATRRCAAVVGFVEEDRDLYNSAAICAGGKMHGSWRKQHLPNYAVFDERRYFAAGSGSGPLFGVAGAHVGITICEDAWVPSGPVLRHAAGGADLVVGINASPYRAGVLAERERMLATRAADASCALAYVNLVGGQDELVFDGASMLFGLDGTLLAAAPQFEEAVVVAEIEVGGVFRKRLLDPRGRVDVAPAQVVPVTDALAEPPPRRRRLSAATSQVPERLGPVAEVYQALVLGTRDYVCKNGFREVVLGLSGGVDSSLVATIAADALGAKQVHGVLMPSRYSSEGSVADAEALAANLGIETLTIPIEPLHAGFLEMLAPYFAGRPEDLSEENLQSRVRGVILMGLSNKLGWLVLTTGNKSEMAVGYSTLYGDMAGGFAVIKDVPKTLVYQLCQLRNGRAGRDLVPQSVLVKPPSAELRPDQRDDQSLPPYEVLDPILEGYVERDRAVADLVADGFDEAVVRRVIRLVDRSEYKRRQAPPGVRVTSRAFGKDRRMPITNAYAP